MRMRGYKQAHMNLRIQGCNHASMQASTYEPEDMRMQGYKQAHTGMPARTYEHEVTKI